MIVRIAASIAALFVLFVAPTEVVAQASTPACVQAFEACARACARNNPDSAAGRQGCQARCEAERAAGEAQAAVDQAKPWVKRKVDEMWRFLEGFLSGPGGNGNGNGNDVPPPAPRPKSAPEQTET